MSSPVRPHGHRHAGRPVPQQEAAVRRHPARGHRLHRRRRVRPGHPQGRRGDVPPGPRPDQRAQPAWPTPPWTPSPWWSSPATCPATTSAATPTRRSRCTRTATSTSMLEPVCKRLLAGRRRGGPALHILDRAFRLAESGRPGPVLVDMPMDMFSREMEEDLWARTYRDSPRDRRSPPWTPPAARRPSPRSWWRPSARCSTPAAASCWPRRRRSWPRWRSSWTSPCPGPWPGRAACPTRHPLMIGQTGFWGLEFTHS